MSKVEPRKQLFTVTYGGWYQRTTIHLSEIYELFALGQSHLDLDKDKIKSLYTNLDLQNVSRENANLEYVKAETSDGIVIKYYEDGLYILQLKTNDIKKGKEKIEKYFNTYFNPAISYIFSLGAPTPKVLANIKNVHPTVVSFTKDKSDDFVPNENEFGEVYSKISSDNITVYKTPLYIFIVFSKNKSTEVYDLIEMQIFFREFKDQLEKYLNIHRNIWELISSIKESKEIKGKEISEIRSKLDSYQKIISLINNRINQMGLYVNTRSSLAKELNIDKKLVVLFQYKFETLLNTLCYIKEIWKMTQDYLSSAIQIIVELENQSTNNSIRSLQIITSVGVLSGIIGYMARDSLPAISFYGLIYFLLLVSVTIIVNFIIDKIYRTLKYKINFTDRASNI